MAHEWLRGWQTHSTLRFFKCFCCNAALSLLTLGSDGSALSGVEGMAERLWEELMLRMLQQSPDAHCLGSEIGSPDGANQRDKWRGREQKII